MKNKKPLIALVLLLLIGVVGGTFAYFTSSATFDNIFKTKPYGTVFTEEFESPDNWLPGQKVEKKVYAQNTGDVEVAVRLSYTEKWVSANGDELGLTDSNNKTVALVNFVENSGWYKVADHYYYNEFLATDAKTSTFIDGVTFNEEAVNNLSGEGSTCVTSEDGKTVTCTSSGDGYDGATYTLTITIETIQSDVAEDVWNVDFTTDENGNKIVTEHADAA